MTGSSLFNDQGKLYHFNGLEAAYGWSNLALVMRTSSDNGKSWSKARLINENHQLRNQVIHGAIKTKEGYLIQPCDAVSSGKGGTAIHISKDNGQTWKDYGAGKDEPEFTEGKNGAWIAGIHAGVVQLDDGRLMALGRGNNIKGKMPKSISEDMGKTWTYSASEFPPIAGGQRLVLMKLQEGPLLLVSFTDSSTKLREGKADGLLMSDGDGNKQKGYGMFAALSLDDGNSWPIKKLITPGNTNNKLNGGAWTGEFVLNETHAEPKGYLAATQSPECIIHLISSALYYKFNLAWLKEPITEFFDF